MDVVLGVSMTPVAVRMVLVEGADATGVTIDHHCDTLGTGTAADQVVAGILGTRDSAAEGAHRIASIGVAWTDRAAAAELTRALRANDIDEVILVSELHAASALAQAIGQALGCERTALMFLERDTATLAVVRAADGAVVRVESRSLHAHDAVAGLRHMVAGLERLAQPPQAVFMVGSGIDVAALKPKIAAGTTLTVHAPEDGALALARGAALAAANAPRFEAETVGVTPGTDIPTVAGIITQRAPAGYMAPLGYSAMPDDERAGDEPAGDDPADDEPVESAAAEHEPFMLVGSALMTIFVVGVLALLASLVITTRPTANPRTDPGENAAVLSTSLPNTQAAETIANPVPVVQEAPRTIFVTPRAPAPVASAPAVLPEPVPVPAAVPATPAPVAPAPVVVPILPQLVPQLLPQIVPQSVAPPARSTLTPTSTTTSTTTSTATSTATSTVTSTVTSTPSAPPSATTTQTPTPVETTSSAVESPASSSTTASVAVTTPLVPSGPAA